MTLQQLFDKCNRRSYYSRAAADVWDALNDASLRIYRRVLKEFRGYFVKWDTTTIQLVAGTDEYTCPADLGQIIRLAEQVPGETNWRNILPADVNSATFLARQWDDFIGYDCSPVSQFVYYGPYLPQATAAQTAGVPTETYNVKIAPMPQDRRDVQILYAAKFLEIAGVQSFLTIPLEGHDALTNIAIAELLKQNNDTLAQAFAQDGAGQLEEFLTYVRNRQIQLGAVQEPYVGELD